MYGHYNQPKHVRNQKQTKPFNDSHISLALKNLTLSDFVSHLSALSKPDILLLKHDILRFHSASSSSSSSPPPQHPRFRPSPQNYNVPARPLQIFPHVSSISSNARPVHSSGSSLASVAPLEAILFDIDGTLCDSDPLHFYAFRDMLQEIGFNGGTPITEEFFIKNISGKHNEELREILLPDWEIQRSRKFLEDKEALFRRLASEQLQPMKGLQKLCKWIEDCGLRRAAVTNAPRSNAELLISMLGLSDFFESLVLASECDRVKPFPDPYLKALQELGISHHHAFVFEDSVSGIKAGTGAGMPVVGLGTRNPKQLLTEAGAVFVIEDFDDPKLWTELEELKIKAEVTTTTEL